MKNKTLEILLVTVLVNILFACGVYFSPEINIPYSYNKEFKIKIPDYKILFNYDKENNKTTDSLINSYITNTNKSKVPHRTSLTGITPKVVNKFFYNPNNNGNYTLDVFFKALIEERNTNIVRIAHYGDSQLEGDRITCYLRNNFQNKFGGSGIGFVPFNDIASNVNYTYSYSSNWLRYTVFHNRYGCGYYGISGNVYKYLKNTKAENDTAYNTKYDSFAVKRLNYAVSQNATFGISLFPNVVYSNISVMYGCSKTKCPLTVYNNINNAKILSDTLIPSEGYNIQTLNIPTNIRSFRLEFSGNISPDFYGLLIDGSSGVQVDNYAIRGHSGDGLLLISPEYLAIQLKKLNVKLVIFQFGNNVVPYINTDAQFAYIEKMYSDVFSRFKNVAPEIGVLAVGVGDMAIKYNGTYCSYPQISKIRDAQKKAALSTGCAFWDMFDAMGGYNSIISWTNNGLASFDGHFTNKGQKIIGNEIFKAIMVEYNQYKFRQRKKIIS